MKFFDVEAFELDSGAIRIRTDEYGGDSVIDVSLVQLRSICEEFGLVEPSPPDDALARRLSRHLCTVLIALRPKVGLDSVVDRV